MIFWSKTKGFSLKKEPESIALTDEEHNHFCVGLSQGKFVALIDGMLTLVDPPDPLESDKILSLRNTRNLLLQRTDWIALRQLEQNQIRQVTPALDEVSHQQLLIYRQALRDLPQKYTSSDDWQWPEPPEALRATLEPLIGEPAP